MSEEVLTDDQSHYEISLTGGQAFVGFVLLLLSLAASFAFGLMIGRGQIDEKLAAARKDSVVITEKAPAPARATQVAAPEEDFKEEAPAEITEAPVAPPQKVSVAPPTSAASPADPFYAQLLSTGDQKRAEALAVKLIDSGFSTAHVERGTTDKGDIFRVRVRFPSEGDARAAEAKLKTFVPEVWITRETR